MALLPCRGVLYTGAAIAMLAGCGGGGTPLSPSPVRPAYSVLYSFKGGNDGRDPHAGLVNVNGTLYGTTEYGGGLCHARCFGGTVFAITPSGRETVLHSFAGEPDGVSPDTAVLLNVNGTLYGTTVHGGSGSCKKNGISGCGTVFSITTSGKENVLHRFAGKPDGARPYGGLINVNGTLYGTTETGGTNCHGHGGCGTVFTITTSGAETVLYSFKGGSGDGEYPTQAALLNVNGTLYGTTEGGGTNNWGTIFSITTSGNETVLHSFGSSGDGVLPHGGLLDVNGSLYGTTSNGGSGSCLRYGDAHGCGTVFKITTSGKETLLHSFAGSADGKYPYASLINVNGTLYGTTTAGGANDYGSVFSLSPEDRSP